MVLSVVAGFFDLLSLQKKRGRYGRDEDNEKQPDENDALKDATTLYVGNLLVHWGEHLYKTLMRLQIILHHRGANP